MECVDDFSFLFKMDNGTRENTKKRNRDQEEETQPKINNAQCHVPNTQCRQTHLILHEISKELERANIQMVKSAIEKGTTTFICQVHSLFEC